MQSTVDRCKAFADVAQDLALQPDLLRTAQRLVSVSVRLTGCDVAALWEPGPDGHAVLSACSDAQFGRAAKQAFDQVDDGPMRQAKRLRTACAVSDISAEIRWPTDVAIMQQGGLPIRAVLALPLEVGDKELGQLVLHSGQPGYFAGDVLGVSDVLAQLAALALEAARSAETATELRKALESNRRIGMAIGVLMALKRVTDEQAFALLRVASQHGHRKLRDIAEDVILTGALPELSAHVSAA